MYCTINYLKCFQKMKKLTEIIAQAIRILWNEPEIKSVYEQRGIMTIADTSEYFWDSIDRIMAKDFVPNHMDVLSVHYRTTGLYIINNVLVLKYLLFYLSKV